LVALYFEVISKNWYWYQIFWFPFAVVATIALFFIPESPKFLYEKRRFDECRKVFNYIARFNRVKIDFKFKFDLEVEEI
jgi:hypothetical protein